MPAQKKKTSPIRLRPASLRAGSDLSLQRRGTKHKDIVYAFIDSQNLNLGTKKDIIRHNKKIYHGWELDFRKFRVYLEDKFRVSKAFLFIGYISENKELYSYLSRSGYDLIYKKTVKDSFGKPKGNVDAELVLHCVAIEYKNYDKAVIASGDGDFTCLHQFLEENGKLHKIIIPNKKSMSKLLEPFNKFKVFIEDERRLLGKQKGRRALI
ncbi:MAG: NYN domain-containing protein [bacterium]|nr:NYN domain-containing protein [bacterium]